MHGAVDARATGSAQNAEQQPVPRHPRPVKKFIPLLDSSALTRNPTQTRRNICRALFPDWIEA